MKAPLFPDVCQCTIQGWEHLRAVQMKVECDKRSGSTPAATAMDEDIPLGTSRVTVPLRNDLANRTIKQEVSCQHHIFGIPVSVHQSQLEYTHRSDAVGTPVFVDGLNWIRNVVDVQVDRTIDNNGDVVLSQQPDIARGCCPTNVDATLVWPQSGFYQADSFVFDRKVSG